MQFIFLWTNHKVSCRYWKMIKHMRKVWDILAPHIMWAHCMSSNHWKHKLSFKDVIRLYIQGLRESALSSMSAQPGVLLNLHREVHSWNDFPTWRKRKVGHRWHEDLFTVWVKVQFLRLLPIWVHCYPHEADRNPTGPPVVLYCVTPRFLFFAVLLWLTRNVFSCPQGICSKLSWWANSCRSSSVGLQWAVSTWPTLRWRRPCCRASSTMPCCCWAIPPSSAHAKVTLLFIQDHFNSLDNVEIHTHYSHNIYE